MTRIFLLFCLITLFTKSFAQTGAHSHRPTQRIRGVVTDAVTRKPVSFATVTYDTEGLRGVLTDTLGRFILEEIPVGRASVVVSCMGYDPVRRSEIQVSSAKEVFLEIVLKESVFALGDVTVRPEINKGEALNKMAITGSRMFSVEEASRYAGGFDDPARLVSAFAGVAANQMTNGISIHGNAPHLLQWRLNDIEIPNPNHFADITILGGGVFSSLSSQVLGNSDFLNGAFPAEYTNAVSGVFDMKLRTGNDRNYEQTIQVGSLGFELASEGPINRAKGSSYLVNYRYSATGLANRIGLMDMGGKVIDYQDLNFNVNLPSERAGTFSIWGTALLDHFKNKYDDRDKWEVLNDRSEMSTDQTMYAVGMSHKIGVKKGWVKTTLGNTYFQEDASIDFYNSDFVLKPNQHFSRTFTNLIFDTSYTRRYSSTFHNKTGVRYTEMFYDMYMDRAPYVDAPMEKLFQAKGSTGLFSAYTAGSWDFAPGFLLNAGLSYQRLLLNKKQTFEPRIAVQWKPTGRNTFSIGYGLHSRMEKIDVFFVRVAGKEVNRNLDFTKASHLTFSYSLRITDEMNLRIEPYYQYLYDVPVAIEGSYSVLNRQDYYTKEALINKGKGKNYGIDITFEKYLSRGYYYMITGTLFDSRYSDAAGNWYDTRYNRHYVLNGVAGKEWMMGRRKQNVLGVNLKCTWQGGDRYSPIDLEGTLAHPDHEVQFFEEDAFSMQLKSIFMASYTVSFKMNKKRVSHEFAIKHINATNTKGYAAHEFNEKTQTVEVNSFAFSIPNICYRLDF